ncbi:MAG TPA: hypothetical protein VFF15_08350 [Flavobacteriaceae bacterium]|nr:hypothetical protein [Flavobacteriaceae bacterium]
MTDSSTLKPPVWFWLVSVVALLWNGMGVFAYLARVFVTDEMVAEMPPEQQAEFLREYPAWVTAAFALAVFCGALGCIALLLRKKWAYTLFVLSAIAAIAQHIYIFMNVELTSVVMPVLVIVVCVSLIWFAKKAMKENWIS